MVAAPVVLLTGLSAPAWAADLNIFGGQTYTSSVPAQFDTILDGISFGTGRLTIVAGGQLTANVGLVVGTATTQDGVFNLDGGSFSTARTATAGGTSTFNFNGGTLRATATSATFLQGLTRTNVRDGGAIIDTNGFDVTIGQALVHSNINGDAAVDGGLTKNGLGTLTLTGALSYTGATSVNMGTLSLGDGGNSVTLPGDATVAANGVLDVEHGSLGAGTITNQGNIVFAILGNTPSTAGSAQISSTGLINFFNSSTAGNATINLNVPAAGAPQLQFFDSSTAGNATIVNNAGGVVFTDTSSAGNATISTFTNNPALATGTFFMSNSSGGTSRQIVGANGLLDFTQLASAGTTIGSLEGAGLVAIGAKTLTMGGNNLSTTFSGTIQNAGTVVATGGGITKVGTGTLVLSGNNTYNGATNVNGGTLQADGVITTSNIFVNNGGTLSGVGKIGDPTVNAGGTLAPGNAATPLGTLTIAAPLFMQAGSFFAVTLGTNGNSKVLLTNGATATINGGTVQATFQPGALVSRQYTLLSGGTVTGAFSGLTTTAVPPGFTASLSYTQTSVLLNLQAFLAGTGVGLNANQQAVSNALNTFFNGGGQLPGGFMTLFGLNGPALANALDQLSPQLFGQARFDAWIASQQFASDLMNCRVPGSDMAAVSSEGQCVWVKGRNRATDINATASDLGLRDRTASFAGGAQVALGQNWTLGAALGYDQTNLNGLTTTGTGERFNAGLGLNYMAGALQLGAALTGGWGSLDSSRTVTVAGLAGTLRGSSDIDTYAAHARAAYLLAFGLGYLKPQIDVQVTRLDFSGLSENGSLAALRVAGARDWIVSASPALELGANIAFGTSASLRPFMRAGATWGDHGSLASEAQFLAAPQTFTATTHLDRVMADVATGFDFVARNGIALRLAYEGRFGATMSSNGFVAKGSLPF